LLLAVNPEYVERMTHAFEQAGIARFLVGRVAGRGVGVVDVRRGEVARPARDEIARLFE